MAWAKLGTNTLGSANTTVSSGTITSKTFIQEMFGSIDPSGSGEVQRERFNSDSGGNYAQRNSLNGGADGTSVSQTEIVTGITTAVPGFFVEYMINISAEEKLAIIFYVEQGVAGAGNAPARRELVAKWVNTSAQITQIDRSFATNTYATGSNITVLGTD